MIIKVLICRKRLMHLPKTEQKVLISVCHNRFRNTKFMEEQWQVQDKEGAVIKTQGRLK